MKDIFEKCLLLGWYELGWLTVDHADGDWVGLVCLQLGLQQWDVDLNPLFGDLRICTVLQIHLCAQRLQRQLLIVFTILVCMLILLFFLLFLFSSLLFLLLILVITIRPVFILLQDVYVLDFDFLWLDVADHIRQLGLLFIFFALFMIKEEHKVISVTNWGLLISIFFHGIHDLIRLVIDFHYSLFFIICLVTILIILIIFLISLLIAQLL